MKRLAMLATSEGRWVIEDSAELLAELADPNPDYDAALFAVKNLGFIRFQFFDDSLIEIELHPQNVKLPALLAVQQQVLSSRVKLFRIRYFDTSWQSEITASSEAALSRLSELCSPAFAPPPSQKFVVEPKDYSTLFHDYENPLRLMAQKWRMSFGNFTPSLISFAIEHQLLSRMMIAGVKPQSRDPVFRFIVDGFDWLANDYQFYGIGERIENLPDKEYGAWVTSFYKSVADTGQPRYDQVTAAIEGPRSIARPYCYERLLLPWKTPSDEILVTLSSRRMVGEISAEPTTSESEALVVNISAKSA